MKKFVLFASAIIAFASCTSESYTGTEEAARLAAGDKPITFGSGFRALTRADKTGKAAADDLSGQFYVYGIKSESTDGAGAIGAGNLVYNNYVVKFSENSGMTTTSNTEGWEYVGYALDTNEKANITDNGGNAVQTIKYWDWGASDYTFYAFSAAPADIAAGSVKVAKNKTETSAVYDNGYTVTLTAAANLDKLFFAERVNVTDKANTIRTVDNKFGGNVTFRFHNTSTKVRVAMYETIPGYKVTIDKFLVDNDGTNPAFADMTDDVTANFAANLQYSPKGVAGTMTVTYDANDGATKNWPIVAFTPTDGKAKVLALGNGLKATQVLGTDISHATFDKADDPSTTDVNESYTSVFPNEANTQNLKLKLNYTLTAVDPDGNATTGETITVEGATAEISADYLKWKPGYAYTYIFKISDNTNGQTGPGTTPAGLYPITFDAVEMVADDGKAEYITTVSEPTITTFGVKVNSSDKFVSYVTGGNEYTLPTGTDKLDIYATFMENSAVITPTASNYKVYSVTTSDATNFPITEASVAEALGESPTGTAKITCTAYTTNVSIATSVPGEDGINITKAAVKLGNIAAGTYAIEYTASAAWTGTYTKVYKVIKVTAP